MGYLVPIQEETREGVTMRIHRFVEKRPVLRALRNRPASPACRGGVVCQDVL